MFTKSGKTASGKPGDTPGAACSSPTGSLFSSNGIAGKVRGLIVKFYTQQGNLHLIVKHTSQLFILHVIAEAPMIDENIQNIRKLL